MASTDKQLKITIQIFGFLRRHMDMQGLPYAIEMGISPKGEVAVDIAKEIGLPPDEIEAVFLNGRVINIYDSVLPGDRVAFFPYGTPGPYRVFLGMAKENVKRSRIEQKDKEKGVDGQA